MCGICGIFNFNGEPVSPVCLRRMTDAIAHRGPDGEGFYIDRFIGLGHRRLSIIDLSEAGHQPMVTTDGSIALTYNGEIYNYREIRLELEILGHRFRSKTDSEVVLHAYEQWKEGCLDRFNGMFAFAIWDKSRQELFLARDRYGIKPVYYVLKGNSLIFASEQKAILTHPAIRREVNLESLVEYFTFQNFFTDRTLLKGMRLLPPGCWTRISIGKNLQDLPCTTYWDYNFRQPENPQRHEDYAEELQRLFIQAVNRQLVSDVDVGSYLSGGIDSGSITAVAARQMPYLKTFTCGFDLHSASGLELGFDERELSEYMSYLFKTEHYEMVLKAGDMERVMPDIAWHIEEPRVGQSYPNYYAAQLASKFVKVVLAGTGGDELFGGYPWRYYRAVVNNNFEEYIDRYYQFWQRLIPNKAIHRVFRPVWRDVNQVWTRDIFKSVFKNPISDFQRPHDYVNHSLYFEAKTFLHGLLVVEDKLSMAHSLENRVPLLDNDLVDFAMQVPVEMKLGNLTDVIRLNENEPGLKPLAYYNKTRDGKLLFREVMKRFIPDKIANGVKKGFSGPDSSWFKGESIEYVKRILFKKRARLYEYLDRESVQQLILEHLEGKTNRRLFIWSLLNFEWWLDRYME